MTDAELRRRVYLETANAIRFYLSSTPQLWTTEWDAKQVHDKLLDSAKAFGVAAMAIFESQKAGIP